MFSISRLLNILLAPLFAAAEKHTVNKAVYKLSEGLTDSEFTKRRFFKASAIIQLLYIIKVANYLYSIT